MFHEAVDHVLSFVGSSPYDIGRSSIEIGDFIQRDVIPYFGFAANEILKASILRIVVDRHYKEMIIRFQQKEQSSCSLSSFSFSASQDPTHDGSVTTNSLTPKKTPSSATRPTLANNNSLRPKNSRRATPQSRKDDEDSCPALSREKVLHLLDNSQVEISSSSSITEGGGTAAASSTVEKYIGVLQFFPQLSLTEKVFGVELRAVSDREAARFACFHAIEGIDPQGRRECNAKDSRRSAVSSGITIFLKKNILKPVFLLDRYEVSLRKRYFPFFAFPCSSAEDTRDNSNAKREIKEEDEEERSSFASHACSSVEEVPSCFSPIDHYFERCRAQKRRQRSFPDVVLNLGLVRSIVMCSPDRQLLLQDAVDAIFRSHGGHTSSLRWHQLSRFTKNQVQLMLVAAGLTIIRAQIVLRGSVRPLKLVMLPEVGSGTSLSVLSPSSVLSFDHNLSMQKCIQKEGDQKETQSSEVGEDGLEESDEEEEHGSDEVEGSDRDEEEEGRNSTTLDSHHPSAWAPVISSPFQEQLILAAREPIFYSPFFPSLLQLVQQMEIRPVTVLSATPFVRFFDHRHRHRLVADSLQRYYELNADHVTRITAILDQNSKQLNLVYYPQALEAQYCKVQSTLRERYRNTTDGEGDEDERKNERHTFSSCDKDVSSVALLPSPTNPTASAARYTDVMVSPSATDSVVPPGVSGYGVTTILGTLFRAPRHAVTLRYLYTRINSKSLNTRILPYLLQTKQIVTSGYTGPLCTRRIGIVALASVTLTEEVKVAVVKEWLEETAKNNATIKLPSIEKLPSVTNGGEVSKARLFLDKEAPRRAVLLANRVLMSRNGYSRHSCQRAGRLHLELWWQWYTRYSHPTRKSDDEKAPHRQEEEKKMASTGSDDVRKKRKRGRREYSTELETVDEDHEMEKEEGKEENHSADPENSTRSRDHYLSSSFSSDAFIPLQKVLSNMSLSSFCILVGVPRIDLGAFPTLQQCQHGGPVYDHLPSGIQEKSLQWHTRLADLPSSVQAWCRIQGYFTFLSAVKELLERKLIRVRQVHPNGAVSSSSSHSFCSLEEDLTFSRDVALPLSFSPPSSSIPDDLTTPSGERNKTKIPPTSLHSTPSCLYTDVSPSSLFSAPISSLEVALAHEGRIGTTRYHFLTQEDHSGTGCAHPGSTAQAVLWYWGQVWRQLSLHRVLLLSSSQKHVPWNMLVLNLTLSRSLAVAKYFRYDVGVLGELLFQRCGQRVPYLRPGVLRCLRDVYLREGHRGADTKRYKHSLSVRDTGMRTKHRNTTFSSPVFRVELCSANVANAVQSALRTSTPFFHLERVMKTIFRMQWNHIRGRSPMAIPSSASLLTPSRDEDGSGSRVQGESTVALYAMPTIASSSSSCVSLASFFVSSCLLYNRHHSQGVLHLSYLAKMMEEALCALWRGGPLSDARVSTADEGTRGTTPPIAPFLSPYLDDDKERRNPSSPVATAEDSNASSFPSSSPRAPEAPLSRRLSPTEKRFPLLWLKLQHVLSPNAECRRTATSRWKDEERGKETTNKEPSMTPLVPPAAPLLAASALPFSSSSSSSPFQSEAHRLLTTPPSSEVISTPLSETPMTTEREMTTDHPRGAARPLSPALFELLVDSMRCILLSDKSHYNPRIARDLIMAFSPREVSHARRFLLGFSAFTKGSRRGRLPFLTFSVVRSLLPVGLCRQFPRPCVNAELLMSWAFSLEASASVLGGVGPHRMMPVPLTDISSSFSSTSTPLPAAVPEMYWNLQKGHEGGDKGCIPDGHVNGMPLESQGEGGGLTPQAVSLREPIRLEASHLLQSEERLASLPLPSFHFPSAAFMLDGRHRVEKKEGPMSFLEVPASRRTRSHRHGEDEGEEEEDERTIEHQQQHIVNILYPARRLQSAVEGRRQKLISVSSLLAGDANQEGDESKSSSPIWFGRVPRYRRTRQATDVIPVDPAPTASETQNVMDSIAAIQKGDIPHGTEATKDVSQPTSVPSSSSSSLSSPPYPLAYPSIFHHVDGSFHSYMWQIFLSTLFRYITRVPGIDYSHLKSTIMNNGIISERSLHAGLAFLVDNGDIICREAFNSNNNDGSADAYTWNHGVGLRDCPSESGISPFARHKRCRYEMGNASHPSLAAMPHAGGTGSRRENEEEQKDAAWKWKRRTFFACIHRMDMFPFD